MHLSHLLGLLRSHEAQSSPHLKQDLVFSRYTYPSEHDLHIPVLQLEHPGTHTNGTPLVTTVEIELSAMVPWDDC